MATKMKKVLAKTETKANDSYEFLINHFSKASTIVSAATALAQHSSIEANIAVKQVEVFLENARLDRTLEVRQGTGNNEDKYMMTRVPQRGAQKPKENPVKTKKTEKKGPSLRMFLLTELAKHPLSKEKVLARARHHFPQLKDSTLATVFTDNIGGRHLLLPKDWQVIVEKKENTILYQTKRVA